MALRTDCFCLKHNILPFSRASYKLYEFGKQFPDNGQIQEQFKKLQVAVSSNLGAR